MTRATFVRAATLALLMACAPSQPDPIVYDGDTCAYCRMQISDRRFGAVLVTTHGRTVKFDSIECLVAYYHQLAAGSRDVRAVQVSDYRHPGTMLDANAARFVDLGPGRTPMGRGWAAVSSVGDAAALGVTDARAIKRWSDLA